MEVVERGDMFGNGRHEKWERWDDNGEMKAEKGEMRDEKGERWDEKG